MDFAGSKGCSILSVMLPQVKFGEARFVEHMLSNQNKAKRPYEYEEKALQTSYKSNHVISVFVIFTQGSKF